MAYALRGAGARVTFTDLPALCGHVRDNVARNLGPDGYRVVPYDWCDGRPATLEGEAFDVVLGTDCVYHAHLVEPFLDALDAVAGPRTTVVLAFERRDEAVLAAFELAPRHTRASSSRPGSANARIVTRGSRPGPEYARIVTPAPSKMPPRKSKKAKTESKSSLAQIALENLLCPITHRLPVRPALAADGHVYERSAIEQWLQTKSTSPLTNAEMATTTMDSTQTRTLIQSAIENGGVDEDAAATWHLESAKLIATGKMPGSISSVKDHLELADALSSSPEIKLLLEAVDLKVQQDALLKRGADAGVGCVASVLGVEKMSFTPMPAWRELREGTSVIRVIDDAAKVERLCERKAPGADAFCGWRDPKAQCCGKFYVVKANRSSCKRYHIENPGTFYVFPFDAVSPAT
ncbi:lysine N-methyltransferase [Aureococcus anophagefferens]|nr:lysine N-methyltransferase [Aureococcus anophagefferens]